MATMSASVEAVFEAPLRSLESAQHDVQRGHLGTALYGIRYALDEATGILGADHEVTLATVAYHDAVYGAYQAAAADPDLTVNADGLREAYLVVRGALTVATEED